jgi:hypothetical protein
MPVRHLPVCPNLDQLKHQAKDLLRDLHAGDSAAIAELKEFHPDPIDPATAKLADAQLVLARSYEAPSWPRLVQATELVNAIWEDDIDTVRRLVTSNPQLIHEDALIRKNSNWGPPMTYAANVGRDAIIRMLHDLGAQDLRSAIDRATLQSKIPTAQMLYEMAGRPKPSAGALGGPAYTLSVEGTAFALEVGAPVVDENGNRLAPVDVVLETDSRRPSAKHAILALYEKYGLRYPDTPTMALHRGRIDLLEAHIAAIRRSSTERSHTRRFFRRRWDRRRSSTRRSARRSTERPFCTFAPTMMKSRSPSGSSRRVRTSTRKRASAKTASAATQRCSARSCRSRISG